MMLLHLLLSIYLPTIQALSCLDCWEVTCNEPSPSSCTSGELVIGVCGCCKECAKAEEESCGGPFGLAGTCASSLFCQDGDDISPGVCKSNNSGPTKCFEVGSPRGGYPFDDSNLFDNFGAITKVQMSRQPNPLWGVNGGLTNLEVHYGPYVMVKHGNAGSTDGPISCMKGNITSVTIGTDPGIRGYVNYLSFSYQDEECGSQDITPSYPSPDDIQYHYFSYNNCPVSHFTGRAGSVLNALGVCFDCNLL